MVGAAPDSSLRLTLIFLCIFLHVFNAAGLFYSHPFPEQLFNHEQIEIQEISAKVNFLLRTAGVYFLGKAADKIGFIKVMKIICLLNIFASLLLTFEFLNVFEKGILFCILRGLFSFLRISCFILPIIYIFRHYKELKHYNYSAFMWTSSIAGIMVANLCAHIPSINWGIIYALNGVFCFMIYSYIGTAELSLSISPELRIKKALTPISKPAFLFTFLLAGILGVGISYQYFYIQHYAMDVMVLKTSGQELLYSPFWITLLLTIIPMAQITKKLEFSKVLSKLLMGILFSVSILYICPSLNEWILFFHKVIFGAFFGLFLSPVLVLIYRLLQGNISYFYVGWVLCLGSACFTLITIYIEKLKLFPSPLLGATLLILLILSCLWINHYFCLSSNNAQEKIGRHDY